MRFHDLYIGANSLSHQGASIPPCLRKFWNFNFELKFSYRKLQLQVEVYVEKITVYTKRSPSYKDYWDIVIVRNSLN